MIPPIGQCLSFSTSQVDLTHSNDYHYCIEVKTIVVMLMIFTIVTHKSTCEVENDKHRPMGGIDGCILLLNELLVICNNNYSYCKQLKGIIGCLSSRSEK